MARPGSIHHAGDGSIQLDIVQAEFRRFDLQRILLIEVAQFDQVLMAEQRVIVDIDLGVQRVNLSVFRAAKWLG